MRAGSRYCRMLLEAEQAIRDGVGRAACGAVSGSKTDRSSRTISVGMTNELMNPCWPRARLGEALLALSRASGLTSSSSEHFHAPDWSGVNEAGLEEWLQAAAQSIRLEVRPAQSSYRDVEMLIRGAGPALLALKLEESIVFLR